MAFYGKKFAFLIKIAKIWQFNIKRSFYWKNDFQNRKRFFRVTETTPMYSIIIFSDSKVLHICDCVLSRETIKYFIWDKKEGLKLMAI
jgi:hypothetical protein